MTCNITNIRTRRAKLPDLVFRFHGLKIVTRNCPLLVTNPHSASEHDKKRYDRKGASLALTCGAHYEAAGTTSNRP